MHALCYVLMSLHVLFLAWHILIAVKQEIVLWEHEATILYIRKCGSNVLRQVIFSNRKPYNIFVRNASSPICKLQRICSSLHIFDFKYDGYQHNFNSQPEYLHLHMILFSPSSAIHPPFPDIYFPISQQQQDPTSVFLLQGWANLIRPFQGCILPAA